MILRFVVKNAKELEETMIKLRARYRRLTSDRYSVCIGVRGITLVPWMSSRHAHVIEFIGIEDIEEIEKVAEYLKRLGFEVLTNCEAVATSA